MANSVAVQKLMDGPRNVVFKITGILDTADVTATSLVDLTTLSPVDIAGSTPTRLIVDKISYSIESPLVVVLAWDATTDVPIALLANGMDDIDFSKYGGAYNTEATGVTGAIMYSTSGYTSGTLSFTVVLECRKK